VEAALDPAGQVQLVKNVPQTDSFTRRRYLSAASEEPTAAGAGQAEGVERPEHPVLEPVPQNGTDPIATVHGGVRPPSRDSQNETR
jgi:hypothetical protein